MSNVKGTLMGAVVEGIRGYRELAREATPRRLWKYLETCVLSSSWYDEEDYLELVCVYARLLLNLATPEARRPPIGMDVFEYIGELGAQRAFHSVPFNAHSTSPNQALYKSFIRPDDPAASLKNYDTFWELRHDTGRVEVVMEGAERARIEIADYAQVSAEYCRVVHGTLRGLLMYAGAGKVEIRETRCRAFGHETCQWELRWKKADSQEVASPVPRGWSG